MNYLKLITVEPSVLVFHLVSELLNVLNANLLLQKSCRFDQTHEPDLNTKCDDEKRGILFVSEAYLKYSTIVIGLHSALSILALPWSDKAGRRRRPLIFIPIIGIMLLSLLGCLHSYFWQLSAFSAVISTTVIGALSGGPMLITPGWQVYICDTCEAEDRTTRFGFVGAVRLVGVILGRGGSGIILRKVGFYYSYLLCLVISSCGLIFGTILVKDASVVVEKKIPIGRMFSNIRHDLIGSFKVVFRKSLASKRIIIALLIVAHSAIHFTYYGELSVLYQYLRYQFGWNERTYSEYMFYKFSTSTLGVVFCSIVLSKHLKLHDGLVGILAASFDTIAVIGLLLAIRDWQIYLLPLIDIFHGTALVITMSFMSKYYHSDEFGRLGAVVNVFASSGALSYSAYNAIYTHTLDTFPSAFCLLSLVLNVITLVCFCVAFVLSKKLDGENSTVANPHFAEDADDEVTAKTRMMTVSREYKGNSFCVN